MPPCFRSAASRSSRVRSRGRLRIKEKSTSGLADGAGWECLISLAEGLDQDSMAERFREALEHEAEHLATVRRCYDALILASTKATA